MLWKSLLLIATALWQCRTESSQGPIITNRPTVGGGWECEELQRRSSAFNRLPPRAMARLGAVHQPQPTRRQRFPSRRMYQERMTALTWHYIGTGPNDALRCRVSGTVTSRRAGVALLRVDRANDSVYWLRVAVPEAGTARHWTAQLPGSCDISGVYLWRFE